MRSYLEGCELREEHALHFEESRTETRRGAPGENDEVGGPRYFGLDEFALEVLAEHREEQKQDKVNFGAGYQDHGLVFCQPGVHYYSPMQVGARVKEMLVKAGLTGFSLHSLRHSHASVLLSEGTPLSVVSERLGHADSNITLRVYAHSLPTDHKAASSAWGNALSDFIAKDRSRKAVKSLENWL